MAKSKDTWKIPSEFKDLTPATPGDIDPTTNGIHPELAGLAGKINQLNPEGLKEILATRKLDHEEPEIKEYFIAVKGTEIGKSKEVIKLQRIVEATSARLALIKLAKDFDIQELISVSKL